MKIKPAYVLTATIMAMICGSSSFGQTSRLGQVAEIPFEFYKNEIIIQVQINGKGPFNMMLDTGTDPSAIDLATAKEIGLKLNSTGHQGSGSGASVNLAYQTKLPLVDVGPLQAKNINALAIDLSKISERIGKPIHGILGQSLLNKRIVQIDYPKRIVRFYSKTPFPKTSDRPDTAKHTTLAFRYDDDVLVDNVSVNGKKMTANFDTGSNSGFQITPAAVTELGLNDEVSKGRVTNAVGYNGASENHEGQVKNVTVGGISVDNPAVTFFGKGTGHDKKPWGINIGNVLFKDFVVTIDYRRKTITLERP